MVSSVKGGGADTGVLIIFHWGFLLYVWVQVSKSWPDKTIIFGSKSYALFAFVAYADKPNASNKRKTNFSYKTCEKSNLIIG